MNKATSDVRYRQQYLDDYLQGAADDRNVDKRDEGIVIKGYVLDAEEVADDTIMDTVEQRFRRTRTLAA